jgi:zinc-ribbon domain
MSGLLRRIRRPGGAEEPRTEPIALPDPAHSAPTPSNGEIASEDGPRLPAGVAEEDLERRRMTGRRGKLRRRARYLRRARELALRDLGGLVYESRRRNQFGGALIDEKVKRLAAIDAELRELEAALGTAAGQTVLREPGVGGTCPRCGELHASDARFCAACGLELGAEPPAPAAEPTAAEPADSQAQTADPRAADEPIDRPERTADPTESHEPAEGTAAPKEADEHGAGNGRLASARGASEAATPDRPA